MKSKEQVHMGIKKLKQQQAMCFSPIDGLLLSHDINLLEWVLEEEEQ
jgi:hypothetical protein